MPPKPESVRYKQAKNGSEEGVGIWVQERDFANVVWLDLSPVAKRWTLLWLVMLLITGMSGSCSRPG